MQQQRRQQADRRRLARAVLPQDGHRLALLHGEGDVLQRREERAPTALAAAELLAQVLNFDCEHAVLLVRWNGGHGSAARQERGRRTGSEASAEEQHRERHQQPPRPYRNAVLLAWRVYELVDHEQRLAGLGRFALRGDLPEVGIFDHLRGRAGACHQIAHRLRGVVREAVRALRPRREVDGLSLVQQSPAIGSTKRRLPRARSTAPPTRGGSGTPSTHRAEARRRWRPASLRAARGGSSWRDRRPVVLGTRVPLVRPDAHADILPM